jgi:hypothetical protein
MLHMGLNHSLDASQDADEHPNGVPMMFGGYVSPGLTQMRRIGLCRGSLWLVFGGAIYDSAPPCLQMGA